MANIPGSYPVTCTDDPQPTSSAMTGSAHQIEMDLGDYIAKGTKLTAYLDMDPANVTRSLQAEGKIALNEGIASPFTQPRQLSSRGWECFSDLVEVGGPHLRKRKAIVGSLGVSGTVRTAHSSFAREYTAIHNPADGVIISYLEAGPKFKISQKENIQTLPHLHHWSDVTFLNYKRQAIQQDVPVSRLKHILRTDIESPEMRKVIQMVVGADYQAYLPWPRRRTFAAESDGAKALLGTESGWGVLWMILRHPELGPKRVKSVSVYGQVRDVEDRHDFEAEGNRVHLYFELGDR